MCAFPRQAAAACVGGSADAEAVLIVLNFGGDRAVQLPPPAAGHGWRIAIVTARPEAAGDPGGVYAALAQSVIVCTSAQVSA